MIIFTRKAKQCNAVAAQACHRHTLWMHTRAIAPQQHVLARLNWTDSQASCKGTALNQRNWIKVYASAASALLNRHKYHQQQQQQQKQQCVTHPLQQWCSMLCEVTRVIVPVGASRCSWRPVELAGRAQMKAPKGRQTEPSAQCGRPPGLSCHSRMP